LKILRIALAVILYLNIAGCATVKVTGPTMKQLCDGYVGKHYNEVVQQWGNYNREKDDGQGGKILTWVDIMQPKNYTNFSIDSLGIIYKWQSNQKTKADIQIEKNKRRNNAIMLSIWLSAIGIIILFNYMINHADYGGDISLGDEWF